MAAPFPLPDTVQIFDPTYTTLKFGDVPARVVPINPTPENIYNVGEPGHLKYITHWVDFDSVEPVNDGQDFVGLYHYTAGSEDGDVIEFTTGSWLITLRVAWVQLRYTGTERFYYRAYCCRISQLFE